MPGWRGCGVPGVDRTAGRCCSRSGADREAHALLLHRRLSIIDLGEGGHQPMSTPDERLTIVFNGEIYNYVELRKELESLGHAFRSSSDTEVLLAAWSSWAPDALRRLIGG